jgi:HSP20 family molecular chaperone IbpA
MSRERKRRSIFDIMQDYMEKFERAADEFFGSVFERPSWDTESRSCEPLWSIFVTPDEVIVTADLPYAKPDTVKVEAISNNLIEIAAEMKCKRCFEDFGITHREGDFSSFRGQIRIPVPVAPEKAKVYFKRGILEIHLPRKRGYRIKVE